MTRSFFLQSCTQPATVNLASASSTFTNSEFSKCNTPCFRPGKHRNLNLLLVAGRSTYCPGACSYVFINEVVFRNVPRIQWTRHDQFSPHGSTEYHFHHIHEVLLFLEAANELGVVWSSGDGQKPDSSVTTNLVFCIHTVCVILCMDVVQFMSMGDGRFWPLSLRKVSCKCPAVKCALLPSVPFF